MSTTEVTEEHEEETRQNVITNALSQFPNGPTQEMIEEWKATYGEIFASGFSDTELFVFRPVFRQEWLVLQEQVQKNEAMTEPKFQTEVCDLCILWRSSKQPWDKTKAGTVAALYEMIMQNSNFVSPQTAAMLVVRL